MKANQLLVLGLKKLIIGIIAGLFGVVATQIYMNMGLDLMFDVDESIVGESFIDEFNKIVTVSADCDNVEDYAALNSSSTSYTREILKESGMNSLEKAIKAEEFRIATCKTQKVVNKSPFRPPRKPRARSDMINTS